MGVVVRSYIDILIIIIILFPIPFIAALFWQWHPYLFVHLKNVFHSLKLFIIIYTIKLHICN